MLILFGVTIFVGATLLFLVQPMFARMVLPLLGGAPAVWNTAMVFFQAALLAGYAYAHALTGRLPARRQVLVHLLVLLVPLAVLPIAVPVGWTPPGQDNPIPWLLALLAVAVGLPFFVVSTSAPLLQRWFARRGTAPRATRTSSTRRATSAACSRSWATPCSWSRTSACPRRRERGRSATACWSCCSGPVACSSARSAGVVAAPAVAGGSDAPVSEPEDAPLTAARRLRWVLLVRGAVEPHARRHDLPVHRHRGDPAPVGHAAGALPADVHPGLRPPAADSPPARGRALAPGAAAAGPRARLPRHRAARARAAGPPARPVRRRPRLPRRAGARPPGGPAPHRVLPLDVARRRARRRVHRAAGAGGLHERVGVPAGPRPGLPAGAAPEGRGLDGDPAGPRRGAAGRARPRRDRPRPVGRSAAMPGRRGATWGSSSGCWSSSASRSPAGPVRFGLGIAAVLVAAAFYRGEEGRLLYAERTFFGSTG